ncbi:MAG: hypothetical protein ACP5HG_17675 [Anaerolineae bacterium]
MKRKKWVRISIFATIWFTGMMVAELIRPFIIGQEEQVVNWPVWAVLCAAGGILVAVITEKAEELSQRGKHK